MKVNEERKRWYEERGWTPHGGVGPKFIHTHGFYSARTLADSIANAVRLTTLEVTFPRFALAEVNTHRVFSRNSASSRAIPTEKLIERVRDYPFIPETFNKRVKGMGVGSEMDEDDYEAALGIWLSARDEAIQHVRALTSGMHFPQIDKSRANRLLEPFMWHTAIITSTEWDNFFALRCPDGEEVDFDFPAQPEFQQTAILMRRAMRDSVPRELGEGEWHRPMVDVNEDGDAVRREFRHENDDFYAECLNLISSRRLAKVSYDRHHDPEEIGVSISRSGDLVGSGHFSPTEHIARPLTEHDVIAHGDKVMATCDAWSAYWDAGSGEDKGIDNLWSGNLRGWWQFRKNFKHEANHRLALEAIA